MPEYMTQPQSGWVRGYPRVGGTRVHAYIDTPSIHQNNHSQVWYPCPSTYPDHDQNNQTSLVPRYPRVGATPVHVPRVRPKQPQAGLVLRYPRVGGTPVLIPRVLSKQPQTGWGTRVLWGAPSYIPRVWPKQPQIFWYQGYSWGTRVHTRVWPKQPQMFLAPRYPIFWGHPGTCIPEYGKSTHCSRLPAGYPGNPLRGPPGSPPRGYPGQGTRVHTYLVPEYGKNTAVGHLQGIRVAPGTPGSLG